MTSACWEFVKKTVLRHKKEVPWIDRHHTAQDVVLMLQLFPSSLAILFTQIGFESDVIIVSSKKLFGLVF
jgi:hypothetical protein